MLAIQRDGGGPSCDTETGVVELAQLLYHPVDFLRAGSLWVQDRFGVVEDYEHFRGG